MSLVILTFDPDDPDEKSSLKLSLHARDYQSALEELDEYLRYRIKYEELDEPVSDALQAARNKLHEIVEDRKLTLYED